MEVGEVFGGVLCTLEFLQRKMWKGYLSPVSLVSYFFASLSPNPMEQKVSQACVAVAGVYVFFSCLFVCF
jgi:hypothetical protein